MDDRADNIAHKNRSTVRLLALLVVGMFGLGFAMVPLYDMICAAAGIQSIALSENTRKSNVIGNQITDFERTLVVKFDASVHPDLPWDFAPLKRRMEVHPGVIYEMNYRAENHAGRKVTGQAIPRVIPWQATPYFSKLECFCFTQQTLAGKEQVNMPLRFMVSPDLPDNISSLTLSYTFMNLNVTDQVAVATDPFHLISNSTLNSTEAKRI